MASIVSVNTRAHSVTFVTDQLLVSLKYIISGIGLDVTAFVSSWSSYDLAIKTWLQSGHLSSLVLEISNSGQLVTRSDFTIDYSYGNGDGTMWIDTEALRFAIAKFGTIPSKCNYRIVTILKPGAPDVVGWGEATFLSTAGFVKQNLGTTIGTHAIGVQTEYWRKAS